jgi:hypothetical protein
MQRARDDIVFVANNTELVSQILFNQYILTLCARGVRTFYMEFSRYQVQQTLLMNLYLVIYRFSSLLDLQATNEITITVGDMLGYVMKRVLIMIKRAPNTGTVSFRLRSVVERDEWRACISIYSSAYIGASTKTMVTKPLFGKKLKYYAA